MSSSQSDLMTHWPAMVRAARSVLGPGPEAEECAAIAVAQVWSQERSMDSVEAFMVTVAKRRAIDLLRREVRDRRRLERLARQGGVCADDVAEEVASRSEARWAEAQARELLSANGYRVLRLHADGASTATVARELGISMRSAESHLLRARKTMRAVLARGLAVISFVVVGVRRMGERAAPYLASTAVAGSLWAVVVEVPQGRDLPEPSAKPIDLVKVMPTVLPVAPIRPHLGRSHSRTAGVNVSQGAQRTRSPQEVTRLDGPASMRVVVTHGDTGESDESAASFLFSCLRDFQLSLTQIGCSGEDAKNALTERSDQDLSRP